VRPDRRNLKPKSLPQKFEKLGKGVSPTDPRNVMAVENGRNQHCITFMDPIDADKYPPRQSQTKKSTL